MIGTPDHIIRIRVNLENKVLIPAFGEESGKYDKILHGFRETPRKTNYATQIREATEGQRTISNIDYKLI